MLICRCCKTIGFYIQNHKEDNSLKLLVYKMDVKIFDTISLMSVVSVQQSKELIEVFEVSTRPPMCT